MKTTIKIIIFICLVCVCTPVVYGFELCNFEEHQSLPDTFRITKADIEFYDDISFIRGTIRDSIENPKAYFIEDDEGIMIAIKKENKYVTFYIILENFNEYKFERNDINLIGNEELIIRWYYQDSKGGFDEEFGVSGGFAAVNSKILVWDIDSYKCLLNFEDMNEYDNEWQQFDLNTGNVIDSGRSTDCYEYAVKFDEMQLTIQLIKESKNEECIDVKGDKYFYKLTESGFVLDRKEVGELNNK